MFRLALAGILPAFVLLVDLQPLARAVCTQPPPDMQSWLIGDDTANDHIWLSVGTLYNGGTYAIAKVGAPSESRQLLFEDRVAYQRAIEEVYWRHRIWPKERSDPKPSLDEMMSQATIERKVQDYLNNSELLEQSWQKPIAPEQLQAEMERMSQHTKQPEVLRELFAALGNDPFVIAECLARPVLLERLQVNTAAWPEESLESWNVKGAQGQMPNVIAAANPSYTLPVISNQPNDCVDDSWSATSTANAPDHRSDHTGVWTGSEMIVWGGAFFDGSSDHFLNTGGRYNPSTDSWTATSTTNAPTGRRAHTVVWTGGEMIVWGGVDTSFNYVNTGGRYNPGTDSWTATSTIDAPIGRYYHAAVWTGNEMIVWAGAFYDGHSYHYLNTGGRYNLSTNSWTATSTNNAPPGRQFLTPAAVWTRSEMIVWGGQDGAMSFDTGGRYNPATDSWTATTTANAPVRRLYYTIVWTGSEIIVWGGFDSSFNYLNTGGRYDPDSDSWTATTTINAPAGRYSHTAVWTGTEMIVWGGNDGSGDLNTGGRYNPGTDSWTATNTTNAPSARALQSAVWTGSEMIAWGGYGGSYLNTGGRYCAQASPPIMLSALKGKRSGINTVRLTWSGATSTDIDLYRNGRLIGTTANDGAITHSTGDTGPARYTYQVCEAGTSTCSNDAIVTFPW
jgi:N-acetylneuraminic acid mutarotase